MRTRNLFYEKISHIKDFLRIEEDQARKIKKLARLFHEGVGEDKELDDILEKLECSNTLSRLSQFYNRPSDDEIILLAMDDVLEYRGVECIQYSDSFTSDYDNLLYCNSGDSYGATICQYQDKLFLSTWADCVEQLDKKN
jgi:hypothetical protein